MQKYTSPMYALPISTDSVGSKGGEKKISYIGCMTVVKSLTKTVRMTSNVSVSYIDFEFKKQYEITRPASGSGAVLFWNLYMKHLKERSYCTSEASITLKSMEGCLQTTQHELYMHCEHKYVCENRKQLHMYIWTPFF